METEVWNEQTCEKCGGPFNLHYIGTGRYNLDEEKLEASCSRCDWRTEFLPKGTTVEEGDDV